MPSEHRPAGDFFPQAASQWDQLNASLHNHILLDSRFVGASLQWLGGSDVFLGIQESEAGRSMALLQKTGYGIWQTFQPAQAPLGFFMFRGTSDPEKALLAVLHSLPGMAMQLGILQQDPDFSGFTFQDDKSLVDTPEYIRTPRLSITGTFDEYWKGRSQNLRHNLSRQRKRLAEQGGRIELLCHRSEASVPAALREYARLESAGWKGKEGTAIEENNDQGRFYREMLQAFAATGEAAIYQLLLNGKVVASDLCLARDGMMVVLKTAYDESVPQMSPALLMRQDIVRQLHEENTVRVIEFYGRVLDWHLKWTDQVRTMYHINCFRNRSVAELRGLVKRLA